MPSQDSYFVVRKGLGIGTEALYADGASKKVAIGKTIANYSLDVVGEVYSNDAIYAQGNIGVGTTSNYQTLDVIGTAYISNSIGIGTTAQTQAVQVGAGRTQVVVVTGIGSVGVGTTVPNYNVDIFGNTRITGVATISQSYTGIATIGIGSIFREIVGISTVGFASVTQEIVGISTVGFASVTREIVGISTVGFASVTREIVGISTVGFASVTQEIVGISTVGFASVTESRVGLTTITAEFVETSEIEELLVTGITTTALLDVGIGATILKAEGFSTTDVNDLDDNLLKTINPLIGINTTFPTRTLDVAGDVRIRGEVIDSNNNVGFAYSVLSSDGNNIPGRFLDAANLLVRNKEFIANEVVGFITSTDGPFGANGPNFDYGTAGITTGRTKCKRDIGLIIDAIAFDISKGGNSKSVGAGLSYYSGVTLQYLDDSPTPPLGFSPGYVKQATIAGFSSVAYLSQYVINNALVPDLHQYGDGFGKRADAAGLIEKNIDFIAEVAVDRTLNAFPGFIIPGGNENCISDIKLVLERLIFNLKYGGNDQVWDAANFYAENDVLAGEEDESLYAYEQVKLMAIQAMRNETISTVGSTTTKVQVKDLTIAPDLDFVPACSDIASAIASYVGIVTNTISDSNFINTIARTASNPGSSQLIDLELLPDGNSNISPTGCSNVVSAIYSCVGIVTTIIDGGPSAAPNINNPIGNLVWKPAGPRIGNEWFVNKLGNDDNSGQGPGDAFLTIKKAASVAQPGDTIKVYAGLYVEDGPISLNERVAVVGEDLRRTLVTTRDQTDLYYVKRGCYVSQQSFVGPSNPGRAMVSFPTQGYGYADGTEQNWQSPYIQNCTNFVPDSIGMRVDGSRAGGFKSMVLDAYTQYNQGGIGVSITNFGYAQLVSLFTICCDTAVFCDTGGVCDLNNSNSSFGNYGLVSNGATPLQYTGTVVETPTGDNIDSLIINVGVGASQAFIDTVSLLRSNADFIAAEAVGFVTSTDGPFGIAGTYFDYGGSVIGRNICKRDSTIIVESLCSDLLLLGNANSINAGLAYRDSPNGSLTYLPETSPPPGTLSVGYVKQAELALINYIAGVSTYVAQNLNLPKSYQPGIGSITQVKDLSKTYSSNAQGFINTNAGIITSIIGIGTAAAPALILPKGQRPYDGQISYIDTQYYFVSNIVITNPGSGYDPTIPVEVTIDLPSNTDYFIPAEAAIFEDDINSDGTISNVSLLVSGTGYTQTPPTVTISPPPGAGTQATADAVMEKYFFNPVSSTPVSVGGTTTVTFDQFITYPVSAGATVYFYQSSKIIASSITFEYVGTGINIVNAIPSKGAVPITENQIVATNGGKIPFTSTDQGGNFRISEGITINQNTGTITGQSFSKSLQAEVTPLIIALQQ